MAYKYRKAKVRGLFITDGITKLTRLFLGRGVNREGKPRLPPRLECDHQGL